LEDYFILLEEIFASKIQFSATVKLGANSPPLQRFYCSW